MQAETSNTVPPLQYLPNPVPEQPIYISSGGEDSDIEPANPRPEEAQIIHLRDARALSDLQYAARLAFSVEKSGARGAAMRILALGSEGKSVDPLVPEMVKHLKNAVLMKRVLEDIGGRVDTSDSTVNIIKDAFLMQALRSPSVDEAAVDDHLDLLAGLCATATQACDVGNDYYGRMDKIVEEGIVNSKEELEGLLERANRLLDLVEDILRQDERVVRRRRTVGADGYHADMESLRRRLEATERRVGEHNQGRADFADGLGN